MHTRTLNLEPKLVDLAGTGFSSKAICEALSLSHQTVAKVAARNGIRFNQYRWTPERLAARKAKIDEMRRLRRLGMTYSAIGQIFGLSKQRVQKLLSNANH